MKDDFEKKLIALAGALHRPDPTPAWKAEILAQARREADAIPIRGLLPPRALVLTWAAAWTAIALMTFSTPQDAAQHPASTLATSRADWSQETSFTTSTATLIALDRQYALNGYFP